MTPYGIVYRDNPYALQKSVEIWQKKFGVFNLRTFIKIGGASAAVLLAVNLLLGVFSEDGIFTYISSFVIMTVLVFVLIYVVTNNTYVKQMALLKNNKEDTQIVLYEDRIECGTPYSRSTYYYSDIILCQEENNIITIIVDTAILPLSVQKTNILKGSYDEFSFILRRCMGSKYKYMGGKG